MISFRKLRDRNDWFALALGLPMLVFPALSLLHGIQSLSWPMADGVVTYSTAKNGVRSYRIDLRYRYTYAGREFAGNDYRYQVMLDFGRVRSSEVDKVQARYPVGEAVRVAVNPASPSQSVMLPGPYLVDLLPLAFGAFLLLFGVTTMRVERTRPESQVTVASSEPARPKYTAAKWLSAAGCLLLMFGSRELYRGWSSLSWPTVQGKVLYSAAHRGPNPVTQLWYEYHVGQTRYVGTSIEPAVIPRRSTMWRSRPRGAIPRDAP